MSASIKGYEERKAHAIAYLGSKCVKCGTISNLEFDHIDPSLKSFNVLENWSIGWVRWMKEVDKCQLLCSSCHKLKTYGIAEHGTLRMYRKGCKCTSCKRANNLHARKYK